MTPLPGTGWNHLVMTCVHIAETGGQCYSAMVRNRSEYWQGEILTGTRPHSIIITRYQIRSYETDIAAFYQQMFNVGAEADNADGGDASVDQDEGAVNVAVMEQAQDAAPRRCLKSGKKSVTVTEVEKTEPRVKRGKGTKRDAEEEP